MGKVDKEKELKQQEKQEKEEKKNKKNYINNFIILIIILAAAMGLTIYLCKWYKVYDELEKQTPVIRGTLTYEITNNELEHFLIEDPNSVVYMCTSNNQDCRNYEKEFKKVVEKKKLQESIIYLNLTDADLNEFVNDFNTKYSKKVKLTSYLPAIVIFEDGKVSHLLQGEDNNKLSINKTKSFIEMNKIGE